MDDIDPELAEYVREHWLAGAEHLRGSMDALGGISQYVLTQMSEGDSRRIKGAFRDASDAYEQLMQTGESVLGDEFEDYLKKTIALEDGRG